MIRYITLLTAEQLEERVSERYLGPDALDISQSDLFSRLQSTKRNIKSTLQDQRVVRGFGNLFNAVPFNDSIDNLALNFIPSIFSHCNSPTSSNLSHLAMSHSLAYTESISQ